MQKPGLKAKPEVGIQFGAGGATSSRRDLGGRQPALWSGLFSKPNGLLDAGAYMIMIESEGITENVKSWRTDVGRQLHRCPWAEKVMFEAADPEVFALVYQKLWREVNLFVDHSQIVQLEALRSGIWGTKSLWGRIVTYRE